MINFKVRINSGLWSCEVPAAPPCHHVTGKLKNCALPPLAMIFLHPCHDLALPARHHCLILKHLSNAVTFIYLQYSYYLYVIMMIIMQALPHGKHQHVQVKIMPWNIPPLSQCQTQGPKL